MEDGEERGDWRKEMWKMEREESERRCNICNECKFYTNKKENYIRHCKTAKHANMKVAKLTCENEKLMQQIKNGELPTIDKSSSQDSLSQTSESPEELSEWEKRLEGIN